MKRQLFNLSLEAKKLSDKTYGIQFRSKGIVEFCNKVIGIPIGAKSHIVEIPSIIKSSDLEVQLACIRGIFDADFSLTFKRKNKDVHYYPVIKGTFASKPLMDSIKLVVERLKLNFSSGNYAYFDERIQKMNSEYYIFLPGKTVLDKWLKLIGSNNPNNLTKFIIWKKFGFCPPKTTINQRKLIISGVLDPLSLEN